MLDRERSRRQELEADPAGEGHVSWRRRRSRRPRIIGLPPKILRLTVMRVSRSVSLRHPSFPSLPCYLQGREPVLIGRSAQ